MRTKVSGEKLVPCPFLGCDAELQRANQDQDGRWHPARCGCPKCGVWMYGESSYGHNGFADDEDYTRSASQAIAAWNTRAAVTDHDFAMAVHDGNLWGKCLACKERQGHYLDAETIHRQQEHIAKLEREGAAAFYDASYTRDALKQRDELIREILKALSAECKPYRLNGLPEQVAYFKAKARNIGCEVDE